MKPPLLAAGAPLADYERQAQSLLYGADTASATRLTADGARLSVARSYGFRDWASLADFVTEVERNPGVRQFELAADAVVGGDLESLLAALAARPGLVHDRSTRITAREPSKHRATLLHYVAANGVEDYRQRSPANAVEIALALLDGGADPNAVADMYGGEYATLPMLVSSSPPAEAGVQMPLVELLLDRGADPNEGGTGRWSNPLLTALVFDFTHVGELLARRGARVDRLVLAAGLGRTDAFESLLPGADGSERHCALSLAAQLGRVECVQRLLDCGEDPDRYNPEGFHAHSTPLHQAALNGHEEVVRLLVERGARVDLRDRNWSGTPLEWAEHGGRHAVARYLRCC